MCWHIEPLLARKDLNEAMNIINVNFCGILPWLTAIVNEKLIMLDIYG